MKKIISTIFAGIMCFSALTALAENQIDEVSVILNLHPDYLYTSSEYAEFSLLDGTAAYTQTVPVAASREALGMTFTVPAYEEGKSFSFTPVSGVQNVIYNDVYYAPGQEIPITADKNVIYMTYIPTEGLETECYYNGIKTDIASKIVNNTVMVPVEQTAATIGFPVAQYNSIENTYHLSDLVHDVVITEPVVIDEVAYAPVTTIAWGFGIHLNVVQYDKGYQIFLKDSLKMDAEAYVNSAGLTSDTENLIWVSKANFTVHIFKGSQYNWKEICAFPCAIGAPYTPTCTGTYKFYQRVTAWDYGSYYVGPIMRFNGGYCLHSTLINKNGTERDGRVGVMISHGCVRMKPRNINWMYDTIPLYTTVHITNY